MATPPRLPASPPPVPPPPRAGRPGAEPADLHHQLPAHRGKLDRITDHAKGALDGLTDWIELRIALLKREAKDTVASYKQQAILGASAGVLAALGGLLLLLALAFGLSAIAAIWLGQLTGLLVGFGVLGALFLVAALIVKGKLDEAQRHASSVTLDPVPTPPQTPEPEPAR